MWRTFNPLPLAEDSIIRLNPAVVLLDNCDSTIGFYPQTTGTAQLFSAEDSKILHCLKNSSSPLEINLQLGVNQSDFIEFVKKVQEWAPDAILSIESDLSVAQERHRLEIEAARLRDIWSAMSAEQNTNDVFHQTQLTDAYHQFNQIETTISHAFRERHLALAGRSYGEAFCDWLIENQHITPRCNLLEAGCGIGYFANAILNRLLEKRPDIYNTLSYTLFDISPELQSAQKFRCGTHLDKIKFTLGDIESHDFGNQKFDLIISNEVIADLSVAKISLGNVEQNRPQSVAESIACRYKLDCVPVKHGTDRVGIINTGAIRMLEKFQDCLSQNGIAVISEYGTYTASPKAVNFANHDEYTIHFGHMQQVARQLSFYTNINSMGDAIGFEPTCETITLTSLRTLSDYVLPHLGYKPLPVIAYTPASLKEALGELYSRLGNLQFLPLNHPYSFSPFRFEFMTLSRTSR